MTPAAAQTKFRWVLSHLTALSPAITTPHERTEFVGFLMHQNVVDELERELVGVSAASCRTGKANPL